MRGFAGGSSVLILLATACSPSDETIESVAPTMDAGARRDASDRPPTMDAVTGLDARSDAGAACSGSGTCPAGAACVAGACVGGRGPCASDDACRNDARCLDGVCVPFGGRAGDRNEACTRRPTPAYFAPGELCEWRAAPAGDLFPTFVNVSPTLVAADFGFMRDPDGAPRASIVAVTRAPGGIDSPAVVRVISGTDCSLQSTLTAHLVNGSASAAVGDLDGDGVPEIIASSSADTRPEVRDATDGGLVAFRWNPTMRRFDLLWRSHRAGGASDSYGAAHSWESPSLADLDDDGRPEILYSGIVYGADGTILDEHLGRLTTAGDIAQLGVFGITADVDLDAARSPELVLGDGVYQWDRGARRWALAPYWRGTAANLSGQVAVADFGDFPGTTHGQPEVVVVRLGTARVQTVTGAIVFGPVAIPEGGRGGPPTVADFDGDGRPEFATAGLRRYAVFDLDCRGTPLPDGCESQGIRWTRRNQDASSNVTGSSVFDFNGDGRAEAVYADECFTRVYDGSTGSVLFSRFRSSCTWFEYPIILDTNGDLRAEIAVPSNTQCNVTCATLAPGGFDSTFPGVRCGADDDCPGSTGRCVEGLCRCGDDDGCCTHPGRCRAEGFGCLPPDPGTPGAGNVCRAVVQSPFGGVQIYGDPRGRWVGSRPVWNEHAYSVTNVSDRGTIPRTSARARNWEVAGLNNFRTNTQGSLAPGAAPDLTAGVGRATGCEVVGASRQVQLEAPICNRGTAPAPRGLTVDFVVPGSDAATGATACQATTSRQLEPGQCETVRCAWVGIPQGVTPRIAVVPDRGRTLLQCLTGNDVGEVTDVSCSPPE